MSNVKVEIVESVESISVGVQDYAIQNSVSIIDSSGITINITEIPADVVIPEPEIVYSPLIRATVILKDTGGTPLLTTTVLNQEVKEVEAPDATVTVNSAAFDTVVSGGTLDVPVEYVNGTPVGTIVGGVVEIPNPIVSSGIAYQRPKLTGQTTIYRTGDDAWIKTNRPYAAPPTNPTHIATLVDNVTLAQNNVFGNTYRFTDQSGAKGLNYPMLSGADLLTTDTLIDHLTGLEIGVRDSQTGNNKNWDTAIDECLALNVQGFDDWYLPNIQEWFSFTEFGGNGLGINVIFGLGARIHWSSTTDYTDTTLGVIMTVGITTANIVNRNIKTATRNYFPVRQRY
jgi:hypothetical protein